MAVTLALFVLPYLGIPQVPRHEGITPMVAYRSLLASAV